MSVCLSRCDLALRLLVNDWKQTVEKIQIKIQLENWTWQPEQSWLNFEIRINKTTTSGSYLPFLLDLLIDGLISAAIPASSRFTLCEIVQDTSTYLLPLSIASCLPSADEKSSLVRLWHTINLLVDNYQMPLVRVWNSDSELSLTATLETGSIQVIVLTLHSDSSRSYQVGFVGHQNGGFWFGFIVFS